ncbi:MAG: sugar acetyltransferase [Methylomonas sp.]|nr:MAG: sugar acetyltransferase [Methylomonas sp.]PPD27006.1 MAG: sugar acetyltransferase [Methylomonas sp.]PPD38944.1 MAG: sugar acetyltransferase [Methylomonas sp.]PPD42571.1 MAG: sugar acetyltransferase [Methylomonas sp.]PPD54157.1 MAG: sugar acetyltransferase [Methylomonas sp.]
MNQPVILLGSGGHAKVLLDSLRRREFDVLGVVDPARTKGDDWLGCTVLGGDAAVEAYLPDRVVLVNGLGSLPRDQGGRSRVWQHFHSKGYRFLTLVHPAALLADDVALAEGVQVMAGAIIQAGTVIAKSCIVNTGAIVEHDCRIGHSVHIAPGAVLCGGVTLGDAVHVGAGATLIQDIRVGAGSIIGAGSVVTRDVAARQIVYPARSQIQDLLR